MAFHGEGRLGKMFRDKAFRQDRPFREVAVVDGRNEGVLDRAEGSSMKVLGKFALGDVMAENSIFLVWIGAL